MKRTALTASVVAAAAVSLGILLPGAANTAPVQAKAGGKALFGRAWVAKEVVKGGERKPLAEGTRLVLRLRHGRQSDKARWSAGCNDFAARLEVDGKRLRFRQVVQTLMGCERKLERQDRWIARFLDSDPRWQRKAGRLTLRKGGDAITFKRRARAIEAVPVIHESVPVFVR